MEELDADQLSYVTDSDDLDANHRGAGRTLGKIIDVGGRYLERGIRKLPGVRVAPETPHSHPSTSKLRPADCDISYTDDSDADTASSQDGHGRTLGRILSKAAPHVEQWITRVAERVGRAPDDELKRSLVPKEKYNCQYCRGRCRIFANLPKRMSMADVMKNLIPRNTVGYQICRQNYTGSLLRTEKFTSACKKLVRRSRASNPASRLIAIQTITLLMAFDFNLRVLFISLGAKASIEDTLREVVFPGRNRDTLLKPCRRALACLSGNRAMTAIKEIKAISAVCESDDDLVPVLAESSDSPLRQMLDNLMIEMRDSEYQVITAGFLTNWCADEWVARQLTCWYSDIYTCWFDPKWFYQLWFIVGTSDDPVHQNVVGACLRTLHGYPGVFQDRHPEDDEYNILRERFWDCFAWPLFQLRADTRTRHIYNRIPRDLLEYFVDLWKWGLYTAPTTGFMARGLHAINPSYSDDPLDTLIRRIHNPTFNFILAFRMASVMRPYDLPTDIERGIPSITLSRLWHAYLDSRDEVASLSNLRALMKINYHASCRFMVLLRECNLLDMKRRNALVEWLAELQPPQREDSFIGISVVLPASNDERLPHVYMGWPPETGSPDSSIKLHLHALNCRTSLAWIPVRDISVSGQCPAVYVERPHESGVRRYHIGCLRKIAQEREVPERLTILDDDFYPLDKTWTPRYTDSTDGLHVLVATPNEAASLYWTEGGLTMTHAFDSSITQTLDTSDPSMDDCLTTGSAMHASPMHDGNDSDRFQELYLTVGTTLAQMLSRRPEPLY